MRYKRNQVEEAISRVSNPLSPRPDSELRTRLKRLLDTDRALGRSKRSQDPGQQDFAFYSMDAPGRGAEIWFSEYEAFGLFTALRLMHSGFPQGLAVVLMRHVRTDLEKQHAWILKQHPARPFDQRVIDQQLKPGDLYVGNPDPMFLAITAGERNHLSEPFSYGICRGQAQLMDLILRASRVGLSWTVLE